jgi:hypothetical protein
MTTLEKIRAEITQLQDEWCKETDGWWCYEKALQIIDKYAEQETDIEYIGEFCHKHGLVLMSKEMADKYAEQEPTTRQSCEACIGKNRYVDGMDLCEDCEKCSNFKPKQTEETIDKYENQAKGGE